LVYYKNIKKSLQKEYYQVFVQDLDGILATSTPVSPGKKAARIDSRRDEYLQAASQRDWSRIFVSQNLIE